MSGTSGAGTISNTATGVSNTTAITQSVNQTSGFCITKYTGHSSGCVFPHNLGGTPAFIMAKKTTGIESWHCWHQNLTGTPGASGAYLLLDTNGTVNTGDSSAYTPAPTSTLISTGSSGGVGGTGHSFIMYAWKAVAGVSAFGTHTGVLSSVSGTVVGANGYCGFKPRFVMIKRLNAAYGWYMYESARGGTDSSDFYSLADDVATEVEASARTVTFTSTGFTIDDYAGIGTSGGTYITVAFA
jgi:hypothetical protein